MTEEYCCEWFKKEIDDTRIIYLKSWNQYKIWTCVDEEFENREIEGHIIDYCPFCGKKIGNHYQ